jgi:multicomponent Na+:H+ antiporter subunit G
MTDIIVMILSTIGALYILVAAIGLVRMPDFYTRLSVTVKASTMGAGFLLVAVALNFTEFSTTTKALSVIFFLFVTAPVSGHMICRSAYFSGTKLWDKSVLDDLEGKFDPKTRDLESGEEAAADEMNNEKGLQIADRKI